MLFDLHNDFPTALSARAYSDYVCGQTETVITAAVWTSRLERSRINRIITRLKNLTPAVPIGIEDVGFLGEKGYRTFDFSGVMYCSLTWNYDNALAGGALASGGLTKAGERTIKAMNRAGCALDVAHLNKKSFYKALDIADRVICSHTGFNSHPRSLDENQVRAIAARGGIIGLCAVRAFTDAGDGAALCSVIDRFIGRYGISYLALGTDFFGSEDIPNDINGYARLENNLTTGLGALGYDANAINAILYNNAFNFFTGR